jgi:stress-induced morphogen
MAVDAQELKNLILEGIPGCEVRIEDLRGDGDHYAAFVTSAAFEGKTRIQQHQMVYAALKGKMDKDLHALAIQTSTPEN